MLEDSSDLINPIEPQKPVKAFSKFSNKTKSFVAARKNWPDDDEAPNFLNSFQSTKDSFLDSKERENLRSPLQTNNAKISVLKHFSEDLHVHGNKNSVSGKKPNILKAVKSKSSRSKSPQTQDIHDIFSRENKSTIGSFTTDKYKIIKGYLEGSDVHLRLYYARLEPFTKKIASLCIVHGFGEHLGRFLDLADCFAKQGFVVHLIDMRGFGMSGGARANASVEELHKDVEVLLRQASPNLPLFIYGHSMGAAVVTSLLIRNPYLNITGVILTAGLFGFTENRNMSWIKRWLIKFIGSHIEEFMVNTIISTTALCYNNYNVQDVIKDRLMTPLIGLRLVKAMLELIEFNVPKAHLFSYPCLVIHGTADIITNYKDAIKFYKRATGEDKELRIIEDGMHEVHHDMGNEELKVYMFEWMANRLNKSQKTLGDFNTLKFGLKDKSSTTRTVLTLLLSFLYFFCLKK